MKGVRDEKTPQNSIFERLRNSILDENKVLDQVEPNLLRTLPSILKFYL